MSFTDISKAVEAGAHALTDMSAARETSERVIEAALPELATEWREQHLIPVAHALTHAIDKLATAKAALRHLLNTHTSCMAPDKLDYCREILAELNAEPECARS